MNRNHVDPTLTKYLGSIVSIALNIALVLGILGYFGIQTTSFAAMLAGAGVAIGAAWSGLLGNFAAGRVHARAAAVQGRRLRLRRRRHRHRARARPVRHDDRHARQRADDRRQRQDLRRHDPELLGAAGAPRRPPGAAGRRRRPDRRDRALQGRGGEDPERRHGEPPPEVSLLDLNLVGPVIAVRPYTHTDHYWQVYFDTNEAIVRVCKRGRLAGTDAGADQPHHAGIGRRISTSTLGPGTARFFPLRPRRRGRRACRSPARSRRRRPAPSAARTWRVSLIVAGSNTTTSA